MFGFNPGRENCISVRASKRQQSLLDRYDAQIVGMRAEPSSSLFSKEIVDRPYKDCD